jgi:hypothetical protein
MMTGGGSKTATPASQKSPSTQNQPVVVDSPLGQPTPASKAVSYNQFGFTPEEDLKFRKAILSFESLEPSLRVAPVSDYTAAMVAQGFISAMSQKGKLNVPPTPDNLHKLMVTEIFVANNWDLNVAMKQILGGK